MATITTITAAARSELNEPTTRRISAADILRAANDGYKDIASRAFCIERRFKLPTVAGSRSLVFPWGIRVNQVERIPAVTTAEAPFTYTAGSTTTLAWADDDYELYTGIGPDPEVLTGLGGLVRITPECAGNIDVRGYDPQFWFTWGPYLCIEPIPADVHWLRLYIAQYPAHAMDAVVNVTPEDLPMEFHECLLDYVLYTLAIKLRRWSMVALYYNRYTANIQRRRWEYIQKRATGRADMAIPQSVAFAL